MLYHDRNIWEILYMILTYEPMTKWSNEVEIRLLLLYVDHRDSYTRIHGWTNTLVSRIIGMNVLCKWIVYQQAKVSPANPSSILHVQSLSVTDHTCTIRRLY
jgi:hypothetical protein